MAPSGSTSSKSPAPSKRPVDPGVVVDTDVGDLPAHQVSVAPESVEAELGVVTLAGWLGSQHLLQPLGPRQVDEALVVGLDGVESPLEERAIAFGPGLAQRRQAVDRPGHLHPEVIGDRGQHVHGPHRAIVDDGLVLARRLDEEGGAPV